MLESELISLFALSNLVRIFSSQEYSFEKQSSCPPMDKRIKMSDEFLEGVKVTIGGNVVKVLAWIQNRKRSLG